jgi:hypothetical protein
MVFFSLNLILFIVYIIPACFVLRKFKLKLDQSALINITIYTACFFTRAIMWGLAWAYNEESAAVINTYRGIMINLEYVSAFVLGISLYFFVFEMQGV